MVNFRDFQVSQSVKKIRSMYVFGVQKRVRVKDKACEITHIQT